MPIPGVLSSYKSQILQLPSSILPMTSTHLQLPIPNTLVGGNSMIYLPKNLFMTIKHSKGWQFRFDKNHEYTPHFHDSALHFQVAHFTAFNVWSAKRY